MGIRPAVTRPRLACATPPSTQYTAGSIILIGTKDCANSPEDENRQQKKCMIETKS